MENVSLKYLSYDEISKEFSLKNQKVPWVSYLKNVLKCVFIRYYNSALNILCKTSMITLLNLIWFLFMKVYQDYIIIDFITWVLTLIVAIDTGGLMIEDLPHHLVMLSQSTNPHVLSFMTVVLDV